MPCFRKYNGVLLFGVNNRERVYMYKNLLLTGLVLAGLKLIFAGNASQINYTASDANIFNPERGFTSQVSSGITLSLINSLKNQKISVIQRIYTIPQYRNSVLPESFLNLVEQDLQTARQGGMKLVMRFSYTDRQDGEDAPLDTILTHINQLQPVFERNYDVIAYLEAGFIGAWGEWYYSSNGLNNTNDRRTVLFALLDALPAARCVVIRTPDYKRKIFNDSNPLTPEEAFSGTKKARTGAHNDCFLASATDYGTYLDNDIEGDKDYLNQDNRYVPQGGETCSPSAYSGCSNALADLARMHWSVLNKDYNTDVLNQWVSEGCMEEIKRRLGYRFRLLDAVLGDSVKPGGILPIRFRIVNEGFASPYNARNLEFVIRNKSTGRRYRVVTHEDPRFWQSGDTVEVQLETGLPSSIDEGTYELLMHLADPVEALHDRPEYAIRLANENVWEDSSGYNSMLHDVTVDHTVGGDDYTGDLIFAQLDSGQVMPPSIRIDGEFGDWQNVPQIDIAPDEEFSGDALNDNVDLLDLWVTDDPQNLFISYKTVGAIDSKYFYHVFFDSDNDTSTGFHSAGSHAGIDFMIENESLWEYTGQSGEWSWGYRGTAILMKGNSETNRVELSVGRKTLNLPGNQQELKIVFNINDLDDNHDDDYAPDAYQQRSYNYEFSTTAIRKGEEASVPQTFAVKVFPNPFNSNVVIEYNPGDTGHIQADIYDISGRKIKSLDEGNAGPNRLVWNGQTDSGSPAGSGVYILRIKSKKHYSVSKLILIK